jgi:hypothetical protein
MQNVFSLFHNSSQNKKEIQYLKIHRTHHSNFINFSKMIFDEYRIEKANKICFYLSNVAFELSKYISSYNAVEAQESAKRNCYNDWKKNDILTDFNNIENTGINFHKYKVKNMISIISFGVIYDQIYAAYQLKK